MQMSDANYQLPCCGEAPLVNSAPSADVCRRWDSFYMYANSEQKCEEANVDYTL